MHPEARALGISLGYIRGMNTNRTQEPAGLVVAGAGAAGLMGALSAAHHGADVTLLERDLAGPSNLAVSGGLFPVAGSRWQRTVGIVDSPERFADDIRAKAGDAWNARIVDAIARLTIDAADFLADRVGLELHLLADIVAPGHSVARLHATAGESGRELHALLRAAALAHPAIRIVDDAEVIELLVDAGTVCGVRMRSAGREQTVPAHAVLLATGGFAASRSLLAEFIPAMTDALHIGAGPNDGSAIRIARALGAAVDLMDGYQGQGHVNPGKGTRLGMALPPLGAFMVNRAGERFVNEDVGPSELAAHVLAQPGGVALEVYDQRIHDAVMKQAPYREACAAGAVVTAPDLAALAHAAGGIDPAGLVRTFATFDAATRKRGGDPFGRVTFGAPLAPPFHAAWVTGALAHTQGGLTVDDHGRVLRADDVAIEGLYAAGGAAAGLSGRGGAGYLPGNGLGQSFPLAFVVGRDAGMRAAARRR